MAFFDDALSKTKDFFNVAYKKTGEVVNIEKQKFDVASLKSKREKDFAALGEIYYNIAKEHEEVSDEVRALLDAIGEKNDEIARLNKEIQAAKNKRICPNCSTNIDSDSTFCNACGMKLDESEEG